MSEDVNFEFIRQWAKKEAALDIPESKCAIVTMNLRPVLRKYNLKDMSELVTKLKFKASEDLYHDAIDAVTVHETSFFRNSEPFDYLRNTVFPELLKMRLKTERIGIWSAACSTGQEIYSVAMIIREYFPELLKWELMLYATDISLETLNRAKRGEYNAIEINRGLPDGFKEKYFNKVDDNKWVIKDEIRNMVRFETLNLAESWPRLSPFHVVFLRNVLIYFNEDTKKKILKRLEVYLKRDGILMLGASESIIGLNENWTSRREDNVTLHYLTGF